MYLVMHKDITRVAIFCAAALPAAAYWHSPAGGFPLAITVLMSTTHQVSFYRSFNGKLLAHLLSAIGAALLLFFITQMKLTHFYEQTWIIGCIFLLIIQSSSIRHPLALATGGGILARESLIAILLSCLFAALIFGLDHAIYKHYNHRSK
jgi:hypothetical protein